ncbi:MAG TPA: L,D-transpeptidase family protein, partial [Chryseosolibacter sp.]
TDSLPSAAPMADVLLTDSYLTLYRHIRHGRLNPQTLQRSDLASAVDEEAISSLRGIDNRSLTTNLRMLEPKALQFHELKAALRSFVLANSQDYVQRERAAKIALNMERWRWQQAWPDRYIVVNIPAFQLRAVEDDSVWLRSRVIVGKRQTPTPVMESVIRSFVIYPYWHVPASISTAEFLPELQEDPTYLEKHNFDVLNKAGKVVASDTIQWEIYSAGYFPFILRQREGSENSMGIIKFNFANPFGVYLHDTNSKRLFKRARRDLSHGCVRVNDAVALAHYLVREDDIYVSPEDLDQYLSLQQRLEIKLRKPIPLKLEYFTCEVENGTPRFYDDIYKKDSVMMQALSSPMNRESHDTEKSPF